MEAKEGVEVAPVLTLHAISDSRGTTPLGVVNSAAAQFSYKRVRASVLSHVSDVSQLAIYLDDRTRPAEPTAVFYKILDKELRHDARAELELRGIPSVNLLGPTISIISTLTQHRRQTPRDGAVTPGDTSSCLGGHSRQHDPGLLHDSGAPWRTSQCTLHQPLRRPV